MWLRHSAHPRIGFVNTWLQQLTGLPGFGIDITTLAGLGFVQGLSLAPLAFIMVAAALRAVDPTLEEAGEVHGLNRIRVTLSITLPLVLPALMAAAIYIFVIAVAAFDVPAVMGLASRIYTFSTLIYVKMLNPSGPPEYGVPAAVGTLMFFVAILLTWWYSRFLRQTERYEVVSGRGYRPKLVTLGGWRHAAWGFCWFYLFLGIGAPLIMVAWTSLMPYLQPPSISALNNITTRHFENLDWGTVLRGAWNTVQLMLIVPTVTVAVCLPLAWVIVRSGSRWRFLFEFLTFLPHAMPAVVFGVAALIASLFIIGDYIPLYGTVWIIAIVYLIERVTFGSWVMNAAMMQCHRDLEDAGLVSGMSLFGVLTRIYVPLLLPALAGTWLWVALVSFRELTVAAVLFDPANVTLPVVVWNQWTAGAMGSAAAVTIVMLAVLTPLLLIYWVIAGRLRLIADRWGRDGAVTVHQDVAIYAGELSEGERFSHAFAQGRRGWLHVARGLVRLNGDELREGDGAKIEGERRIELDTDHRAEILLFDLR